jgi:hypothetical protein
MTRIATPATEETLLMWAQHSTAHHMESLASRYRKVKRSQETQAANEQYRDRSLNWYYDEDGSLVIKGRFPAEQGALLLKALQLGMDAAEADADESTADVTAETLAEDVDEEAASQTREPIAARRADALMGMAEAFLADGAKTSTSADRYQVMLHVSAETLTGEVTAETPAEASVDRVGELPLSHIEHGPHVSAETSKRICCDSNVIPILTGKMGEALDIGRKTGTQSAYNQATRAIPGAHRHLSH